MPTPSPSPASLPEDKQHLFLQAQRAYQSGDLDALLELLQSTSTPSIDALMADLERFAPEPPAQA